MEKMRRNAIAGDATRGYPGGTSARSPREYVQAPEAAVTPMRILFSDWARWAKFVAALLLLAGLAAYAAASSHWQCASLGDCLAHPGQCDGRTVVAGTARIAAVSPDAFTVRVGDRFVRFLGSFDGLAAGKYADVEAVFHAPDRFETVAAHAHLERRVKVWGSLAAALIVAALLFRVWRRGGF